MNHIYCCLGILSLTLVGCGKDMTVATKNDVEKINESRICVTENIQLQFSSRPKGYGYEYSEKDYLLSVRSTKTNTTEEENKFSDFINKFTFEENVQYVEGYVEGTEWVYKDGKYTRDRVEKLAYRKTKRDLLYFKEELSKNGKDSLSVIKKFVTYACRNPKAASIIQSESNFGSEGRTEIDQIWACYNECE